MKFSNFMFQGAGGGVDSLFCLKGRVFVHSDCPRGEGFCHLPVESRGIVLDKIDSCIRGGGVSGVVRVKLLGWQPD